MLSPVKRPRFFFSNSWVSAEYILFYRHTSRWRGQGDVNGRINARAQIVNGGYLNASAVLTSGVMIDIGSNTIVGPETCRKTISNWKL